MNLLALSAGGVWLWVSLMAILLLTSPADEAAGDDLGAAEAAPEGFLLALLYLTLPLLAVNVFVFTHYFAVGDPWGLERSLRLFGIDLASLRQSTSGFERVGGVLAIGLFIGAAGTNVAHELIHRTGDRLSLLIGRWLLAFSFDTTFSIEHVHGHHRHVGTVADPATARRGETVFGFASRSFLLGNLSAFRIEAERLRRQHLSVIGVSNKALTGQIMSITILMASWWIGGTDGALIFGLCAMQGKFYLEVVNYIEHYGLVRVPGARVEARHSWNCYRGISNAMLYNLPRHSHHHSYATKPFWTLEVEAGGPVLPFGYMTMIGLALVPPLYMRRMRPLLADWDRHLANEAERDILTRSGALA